MSQNHRVAYRADGRRRRTVVVKLASDDATSRATGVGLGAYLREITFYRSWRRGSAARSPACHLARLRRGRGLVHARPR